MELDQGAFILSVISLSVTLTMVLVNVKRHPANDAPSTYNPAPTISVEGEAQEKKWADANERLFNNKS